VKIVYADLETEWRGGQNQALLTVLGLRARGHDAELIAAKSGALARRAQDAGVPVRAASSAGRRWDARRELRAVLAAGDVDIVHVNEAHSLTAAWLARANRRAALVVSRRVAYLVGRNWASKARFNSADRIFAISKFVAESLLDSGIAPAQISVVYEGVAIPPAITQEARAAARKRWNLAEDEFVLGCVGYLLPEKNQEQLIRALPLLLAREPRCKLFLAGDGSERRHLEALAVGLGLREKVFFAGFVASIAEVYAALDVFVFPSLAEPLGTSLLAAMAYGLPVAAVASGGVPEYVTDRVNGMLAPQPTSEAIAAAIFPLIEDAALRNRLGARARQDMAERFSDSVMVSNTIRAYEEVLRSRK
jgi:glycosyltransferase involved in cell wall biosynthesis